MHTYTLYNSAYTNKNPDLSPVHHLRCDLKMCSRSIEMLTKNNVVADIKKFPTELHCVLTEIPEITFNSTWGEGSSANTVFAPITSMLNNSGVGRIMQLLAGHNNIPLVETNEFSQRVMKEAQRASLKLKFTIYTDTYNNRYNFTSSPYETWLRMLYFSTAPIYKATYMNLFKMITTMAANIRDNAGVISLGADLVTESGAALVNSLPIIDKTQDGDKTANLSNSVRELAKLITEFLVEANKIGHVCWDIVIPGYLHATDNTTSPILWNIKTFNVSFSDKFTRGLVSKKIDVTQIYRPRPLYANFDVTLESNQIMTREQYIKLLFGDMSKIAKLTSKD